MRSILVLLVLVANVFSNSTEIILIKSADGLQITADYYKTNPDTAPLILLFHQAGWSRGEYKEIAPKLNKMGFNCLAVDQRSGGEINNVKNETKKQADNAGKSTNYLDALTDMKAVFDYAGKSLPHKKLIIWGSSYSAGLSFVLTAENQEKIAALLAFSPGEYFKSFGKSSDYISSNAAKINIPVFITSARSEHEKWKSIYNAVPAKGKMYFLPETEGNHGSRALWEKFDDSKDYWAAVSNFLESVK